MLSIVNETSHIYKNHAMSLMSNNFNIAMTIIVAFVLTLIIYGTSKFFHRQQIQIDNKNESENANQTQTNTQIGNQTQNQTQNTITNIAQTQNTVKLNKVPSHNSDKSVTTAITPKLSQIQPTKSDSSQFSSTSFSSTPSSPFPCISSSPSPSLCCGETTHSQKEHSAEESNEGIPTNIEWVKPKATTNYKSATSHKQSSSLFDESVFIDNNNNNRSTMIRRRRITETTIICGDHEPITIKETTEESIDIPNDINVVCDWSPFIQGLRFAVVEDQGKREHMENSTNIVNMSRFFDVHVQNKTDSDIQKRYSFSLFDGHLGDEAAKFCTENLHKYVAHFLNYDTHSEEERISSDDDLFYEKVIKKICRKTHNNDEHNEEHNDSDDIVMSAIRKAFHKTDDKFKKYAYDHQCKAGAVGVYVYYSCDSTVGDHIYVANVGDCRAILCSNGKAQILTTDHNPKNEDEKKRCGDCIDANGELLSGSISVTRAIGDFYEIGAENNDSETKPNASERYHHEKLKGLICDPHIIKHELSKEDEFLIVACDGLWDVVDNANAITECRRTLRKYGDVDKAAEKLISLAKHKSSQCKLVAPNQKNDESTNLTSDNISVMVIGFANKDSKTGKEYIGPKMEVIPRPKRRSFGFRKK